MAKNIMEKFKLNAIAAVDRPCQEGAKAVIMKRAIHGSLPLYKMEGIDALPATVQEYAKRDFSADQRTQAAASGAAMPDGSFPIKDRGDLENAIRLAGHAKDPAKAKSHIVARARALDATSILPKEWKASKSIGGDLIQEIVRICPQALPDLLENVNKSEEIQDELRKLADKKIAKAKLAEWDVAKNALIGSAWSIVDEASPDDVPSLLRKTFSDYKDHIESLLPRAAHEGEETMKAIAKALGLPETATEAEIAKALEANAAKLAKSEKISGLTSVEKAYFDSAVLKTDGEKDAFLALDTAGRGAMMKAKPMKPGNDDEDDDSAGDCKKAFKTASGALIRKSVVGDAVYEVLKAQNLENIETRSDLAKMTETAAVGTIAKSLEPLTSVIGKADGLGAILYRIEKGRTTKADADAIMAVLKSANEIVSKSEKITKEFGAQGNGNVGTAGQAIAAKAEEIMKSGEKVNGKPVRIEKARDMVRERFPDLAKQEATERSEARKAA